MNQGNLRESFLDRVNVRALPIGGDGFDVFSFFFWKWTTEEVVNMGDFSSFHQIKHHSLSRITENRRVTIPFWMSFSSKGMGNGGSSEHLFIPRETSRFKRPLDGLKTTM